MRTEPMWIVEGLCVSLFPSQRLDGLEDIWGENCLDEKLSSFGKCVRCAHVHMPTHLGPSLTRKIQVSQGDSAATLREQRRRRKAAYSLPSEFKGQKWEASVIIEFNRTETKPKGLTVMWLSNRVNAVTRPLIRRNAKQWLLLTCFPIPASYICTRILICEWGYAFYVRKCVFSFRKHCIEGVQKQLSTNQPPCRHQLSRWRV